MSPEVHTNAGGQISHHFLVLHLGWGSGLLKLMGDRSLRHCTDA